MKHYLTILLCLFSVFTAQAEENIKVGNTTRNMIVYAPSQLPENAPLVISLHGANQDAAYQRNQTNWNNCADTAKFVVVYPNAINKFWDTGCARGTGDLLFIETVIDSMYSRYHINRNRVYVSGFSLGAMMTYHCVEHLSDKVAAAAPVSGVRFDNKAPKSSRQVPLIHTHGTGDDVFKWTGDPNHAAGGYPYIPDYVQKWATYYGCSTKKVIKPYPSTKQNSNATYTRWSKDGSTVEVALLQLEGKGHWHSEDIAGGVSTTQEIWKFMKRYSLGPDAPAVKTVEPENLSFDLPLSQRQFVLSLDKEADCSKVTAKLTNQGKQIALQLAETGVSKTLTFTVPEGTELGEGDTRLAVADICDPEGGMGNTFSCSYIYGITEVADELTLDTLLRPDWDEMQAEYGQCIPIGWRRIYVKSDGTKEFGNSGDANLASGCRLLYFPAGGDFTSGFYLSAREFSEGIISYGRYAAHRLVLPVGKCELTFRSIYWSTGASEAGATFDVNLYQLPANVQIFSQTGIKPKGCQAESQTAKVKGSASHSFVINIEKAGNHMLDFCMSQGWNSILLADVMITTYPSIPEQYKGTFTRLLKEAQARYEAGAEEKYAAKLEALKECIDKYADFASTSPTAYTAAINELRAALKALPEIPTGIAAAAVNVPQQVQYFTVDGRRVEAPVKGITIERRIDANGEVKVRKVKTQQTI